MNSSGQGWEGFSCCCCFASVAPFERAPPRPPLVEVEDAFLVLVFGGGVSVVGIDALNAGSIRSSLITTGDGAACCCFLSSSADISCFVEK